jgi:hypothetical protein
MTLRTKEIGMEHNVGGVDRTVRVVVGLALLSLVVLLEGNAAGGIDRCRSFTDCSGGAGVPPVRPQDRKAGE